MTSKVTVDKQTYRDFREQVSNLPIGYVVDHDDNYLYTEEWDDGGYQTVRIPYTMTNGVVSVDTSAKEVVVRDTTYDVVQSPVEKKLGTLEAMVAKLLGRSELRKFNDKSCEVIEPLYTPFGKVDGHGDAYKDENGPYDLVKSFNDNIDTIQKAINHEHATDCFDIVEAWVNDKDTVLAGEPVTALQPLVKLRYTEKAYELRKANKLQAPSIGCNAWTEAVNKSLKDEMEVKPQRYLFDFDFSEKKHHLSLTTASVGGPASGENWFIDLSKAMKDPEDLAILDELGEEFKELEKKKQVSLDNQEKAPSTSGTEAQDAGVDNTTLNEGKDNNMSDTISKAEFEALQTELAKMKAEKVKTDVEKSVASYQFEADVLEGLVGALVDVDDKDAVIKAFDVLVARVESAESDKAEVEKSAKTPAKEPTELEKAMAQEEGEAGDEHLSEAQSKQDSVLKQYRELDRNS